ncbi:substrate-binding domain-containing protein [Streptomyces sp. KR80]|uniref:substrate-binding domain-containing protein n=1 Tax=Streptomyces sp. KR80 TaxID=3457426 RepID=UPI003FD19F55
MAEQGPAGAAGQRKQPGRLTIGLVTANIHLGVGATLWSGVRRAAERADVNLVCFPGGPLRPGASRSALYELVGPARLDGVVCWSSTLGLPASGDHAERLLRSLEHLPVVSLNRVLAGHEALRLDSCAGMRELVGHLVARHGVRRPACIRGPLNNPVSFERYRAYTGALAQYRLPAERSLVCAAGEFGAGVGASAMRVLLDARGLRPGADFDAVVACSDVLAADALRLLAERGIHVPEDVAVVGFNDSPEAWLSDPPLTSVALPFAELGELAVDTLVASLRGTRPPDRTAVAGAVVVRRSCGCPSPLVAQAVPDGGPSSHADAFPPPVDAGQRRALEEIFGVLPCAGRELAAAFRADAGPTNRAGAGHATARRPAEPAGVTTGAAGRSPGGVRGFLPLLEYLLGRHVHTLEEVAAWDRALLEIRDRAVWCLPAAARVRGERLLAQARLMANDTSRRLLEYERWADGREADRLREFGTELSTVVDLDGLSEVLERHAAADELPGCRLVLYEDAWERRSGAGRGLARALPAPSERTPGGRGEGPEPRTYPADLLLPDELMPRTGRFTFVLEPLHIGAEHVGFAVFEASAGQGSDRRGALYRALGDQISAALKGIRLFGEVRRARDAAEQASTFKTRLLAQVTQELRGPLEEIRRHAGAELGGSGPEVLVRVHRDAGRLLRMVDDLLDWSRTESDDLGLCRRLIDPRPVLAEAFGSVTAAEPGGAGWTLALPRRLPAVLADRERLGQAVHHVLAAAAACASVPECVVLAARMLPTSVRITVTAPTDRPAELWADGAAGAGIGSVTARRLVMLHGGSFTVGHGPRHARLTVDLPLPAPQGPRVLPARGGRTLLTVGVGRPAEDVAALARHHGLRLCRLDPGAGPASFAGERTVAAVVWDAEAAGPEEWRVAQRLHDHPALSGTPFLLFGATGEDLAGALRALRPAETQNPVIVVDGSAPSRERLQSVVATALPSHPVRTAADGTAALALIAEEVPRLVITQRALADMDGFDLVDRIRVAPGRPHCPVLLLSAEGFTFADAHRARCHPGLVLLDRGILTQGETARLVVGMTQNKTAAAGRNRILVHQALAYLQAHYQHRISRWQVAQAVGVSADHLGRLFHEQFGLTVWDYLTRLRIQRAGERLRSSGDNIQSVARAVGFSDRAYFSRVFRKVTGVAPRAFRAAAGEVAVIDPQDGEGAPAADGGFQQASDAQRPALPGPASA